MGFQYARCMYHRSVRCHCNVINHAYVFIRSPERLTGNPNIVIHEHIKCLFSSVYSVVFAQMLIQLEGTDTTCIHAT